MSYLQVRWGQERWTASARGSLDWLWRGSPKSPFALSATQRRSSSSAPRAFPSLFQAPRLVSFPASASSTDAEEKEREVVEYPVSPSSPVKMIVDCLTLIIFLRESVSHPGKLPRLLLRVKGSGHFCFWCGRMNEGERAGQGKAWECID